MTKLEFDALSDEAFILRMMQRWLKVTKSI